MAIGIDRAVLLETDGREWDPVATAARDRRRDPRPGGGRRPVRPDPVRQRGGRQRRLPGRDPGRRRARPAVRHRRQGARASATAPRPPGARRPAAAGRSTRCRCRRSCRSRRASTCRAIRPCRGGSGRSKKEIERIDAARWPRLGGLDEDRPAPARGGGATAEILGQGPEAAPAVVELLVRIGRAGRDERRSSSSSSTPTARPDRCSLEALALARGLAAASAAAVEAVARRRRARRGGGRRRSAGHGVGDGPSSSSDPRSTARPGGLGRGDRRVVAVRGAGRRHRGSGTRTRQRGPGPRRRPDGPADGRELPRRSRPGRAILAADPPALGRQPARGLPGSTRRRAADGRPARRPVDEAAAAAPAPAVERSRRELSRRRPRASGSPAARPRSAGGSRWPTRRSSSAAAAASAARRRSASSRSSPGCSAARSAARAS